MAEGVSQNDQEETELDITPEEVRRDFHPQITEGTITDETPDDVKTEKKYRAGAVSTTEMIEHLAIYQAEKELNEKQNEKGFGVKKMTRKLYLRYFEQMERQRLINKYRRQLKSSYESGDEALKKEMSATLDRFVAEDSGQLLHEGEVKQEADQEVTSQLKDVITQFAEGRITEEQLEEVKDIIVDRAAKGSRETTLSLDFKADNIVEIAKQIKADYEHGMSLEDLDEEFELVIGRARGGLRTERQFNAIDKAIDFMQRTPGLNFIQPEIAGVALGFIYSVGSFGAQRLGRSKLAWLGTFGAAGVFGFGYGAARENKNIKTDFAMHVREMATGGKIEEGSKRREEVEKFRLEVINAARTTEQLKQLSNAEMTPENLKALLDLITEVKIRNEISDTQEVDLIGFSDVMKIEQERRDLDVAIAQAEIAFKKGYDQESFNGLTYDQLVDGGLEAIRMNLGTEMDTKSEDFKRYKLKRSLIAGGRSALIGMGAGFIMHEAVGAWQHAANPDNGISAMHLSPVQRLIMMARGENQPRMTGELHQVAIDKYHSMSLPKGVDLIHHKDGTYSLFNSGDRTTIADHIKFNHDGTLSKESLDHLHAAGINIGDHESLVTETHTRTVTESADDFARKGGKIDGHQFIRQYRDGWGHMPPDIRNAAGEMIGRDNELRFDMGTNKNGDFVFDMTRMMGHVSQSPDRSLLVTPDLVEKGKVFINVSLTQGTNRYNMSLPVVRVGDHYQCVLEKGSDLMKSLTTNHGGQVVFNGRFAEVAVQEARDGKLHNWILATEQGRGLGEITRTITDQVQHEAHRYAADIPRDFEVEAPPFIPIFGRRPLEKLAKEGLGHIPYSREEPKPDMYERWRKQRSPRLNENPLVQLDQQQEIGWYFTSGGGNGGSEYIHQLDENIENDAVLSGLTSETKIISCIPVAAAHESANIYNTLRLYARQPRESRQRSAVLLNLNWPDDANMEEVRKTIAEVERAKKDFPELKIAVTTKVMKRSWIEEKEGAIYGTLIKELYDTALRAIQKAGLEDDVYLLTNDADTRGLSADYVGSFLRFVESHPNLDGAIGKIDWGSEAWADYPGFHVAMRYIQLIDTAYRNRTGAQKGISSHGPNFIMKASMYAAIGGNETEIGAGADTDIGKRMVAARIGDRKEFRQGEYPLGYNNGAWVDSDPSRALEFYKRNAPVVDRWNDWDEGGYKPRQDLESLTGDSEDLDSDFENILKRIEFQVSEATSKWISFYNRELAEATLNIAFPPKDGKPMWEIVDDSHIVFTEVGREVMREQLSLYRKENRQNIKYEKGRGGVRAGEEGTPGPAGSPWARATRRAEAAGNGGGGNAETTPFATIQPEQAAELTSEGRRKITEEALKAADLLKPNREVRIGTRVAKVRSVDYEREFLEITSFSNDRETRFIPISEILRRPSYKRKAAVKHYLELVDNR